MIVSEAKKIGMQIQIARKKRQLSQADLAQMVDLTPKYLSMIECGTKTPKLETLISIANALETDANSLLAGVLNTSSVVESAFFSDVIDKYQELSKRQQEKSFAFVECVDYRRTPRELNNYDESPAPR